MIDIMFYEAWKAEGSFELKKLAASVDGVFEAILVDAALPDMRESLVDIRKLLDLENKDA